ncbi:hypothetical protein H0H81_010648 [Sphagnurus paluster]|uniref:Uncharacterized protein n=1 Tax=Sphagnurus paluster TaxID=117069 RepID=A0A9P7GPS7_9AGAR|nr:hypothetical protein H0H81_010648 [Sphagnurus paluster]
MQVCLNDKFIALRSHSWCAALEIGVKIDSIDLDFIRENAAKILKDTTVNYLKAAQLRGALFQDSPDSGVVSSVYTAFFVDHAEPLAALESFRKAGRWCLGELVEGHEYFVVFPVRTH